MVIVELTDNQPSDGGGGDKKRMAFDMQNMSQSELYNLARSSSDFDLHKSPEIVDIPNIESDHPSTVSTTRYPSRILAFGPRRHPHRPISGSPDDDVDNQQMTENKLILNSLDKLLEGGVNDSNYQLTQNLLVVIDNESGVQKRSRKRKSMAAEEDSEELGVITVNGGEIDLNFLARVADGAFQAELNRLTVGMVSVDDFLGFLADLKGRWGSYRKRRMYVDAARFVNGLPGGWKIQLSLRPRIRQPSLYCRRFVSPLGVHFNSCKDVAFYLKSQFDNPPEEGTMMQIESYCQVDLEAAHGSPATKVGLHLTESNNYQSPIKANSVNQDLVVAYKDINTSHSELKNVPMNEEKSEKSDEGLSVINVNGKQIDLKFLACFGDSVFEDELKKLTVGMASKHELLGFVSDLKGIWGSARKRRRYVDPTIFTQSLPAGWKIQLSLRPRARQPSLYCRRFVSPSGIHFKSCKDVAFYLRSQFVANDATPFEEGAVINSDVVYKDPGEGSSKNDEDLEGLGVINVNSEQIDLKFLADFGDDAFQTELNKLTVGMASEGELLGSMKGLEGQWGSKRMRRMYVDPTRFVQALPAGWKILLSLRPRVRPPSLYCRKFMSPTGIHFNSCKDVAFYLKSQFAIVTNNPNHHEETAIMLLENNYQVDPEPATQITKSSPPAANSNLLGTNDLNKDTVNELENISKNRNLKTRCIWCLVMFFCEPVDAETLVSSSGFVCPKCKKEITSRLETNLAHFYPHADE